MKICFIQSPDKRSPVSSASFKKLEKAGHEVFVDKALSSIIQDDSIQYYDIDSVISKADVVISLAPPDKSKLDKIKSGGHLISIYQPYIPGFEMDSNGREDISIYSLDMIPRSTLAQSMDILSSMASISGYKAVLLAAYKLPRFFPLMMTAAGTIRPANILIIGAGVAGLQAIATARKLGAKVEAFDVRSAVKEEVQSLGAKFVEVQGAKDDKDAGGYAVEQTEEFKRKQKEAIAQSAAKSDVIITTAQLRGRTAPILITEAMIKDMQPGSVIIDMASSTGGNCEGIQDKQEIVFHGVTMIGDSELYLQCITDSTDLISNNIANYLKMFEESEDGKINASHEILTSSKIYPTN